MVGEARVSLRGYADVDKRWVRTRSRRRGNNGESRGWGNSRRCRDCDSRCRGQFGTGGTQLLEMVGTNHLSETQVDTEQVADGKLHNRNINGYLVLAGPHLQNSGRFLRRPESRGACCLPGVLTGAASRGMNGPPGTRRPTGGLSAAGQLLRAGLRSPSVVGARSPT